MALCVYGSLVGLDAVEIGRIFDSLHHHTKKMPPLCVWQMRIAQQQTRVDRLRAIASHRFSGPSFRRILFANVADLVCYIYFHDPAKLKKFLLEFESSAGDFKYQEMLVRTWC